MALTDADKLAFAARYAEASRSNDGEAYAALCAPDAVTWHNHDGLEVGTEHVVRSIRWLHKTIPDLAWTHHTVMPTPTGFVSQSVMTGTAPGGPMSLHSCIIVTLNDDGLLTRCDEYLDSAQTAPLRG